MTRSSIAQGSFTVEHRFAAAPSRVFRALSDPDEMPLWAAPSADWSFVVDRFEFRLGGTSICRFGPQGEEPFLDTGRYDDIIPDQRFVSAYAISRGEVRISSSVTSYEFLAQEDGGTLLRVSEMGLYFDGHDSGDGRRGGVAQQLGQLDRFLGRR